jgi:integrase
MGEFDADVDLEVVEGEVVSDDAALELFGAPTLPEQPEVYPQPDLAAEWREAHAQWLEDSSSSRKTRTAYRRAWNDLWSFVDTLRYREDGIARVRRGEFWSITHRHVRRWMRDLEERPLDPRRVEALQRRGSDRTCGYAASTINLYLAAVSSFYSYAENNWPVLLADGREVALSLLSGLTLNPVRVIKRKAAVGAAQREQPYLSFEQLRQFLNAIPKSTAAGQRDYALFLLYIMTGARNSEARTLQWQDFQERGGRRFWFWRGKGSGRKENKTAWKELPPECWEAITRYLKLVGRWDSMRAEDYVFTAVSDAAANLPTVDAEAWSPYSQPLSAREVNRRLKMHAARAGLESRDIHVHTLRHSAAMLMDEAGADLAEIMKFLNHESLATTQRYIHKMRGQRNVHAAKMAELLNL